MLEFMDKTKRDRTGISSDGQGLSPDALKNIQTSVLAQAFDLSRMKIEAVVRIFAETGLKSLFQHIHELVLKHQNKEEVVQLRNRWVKVNPAEWRTRMNMTVKIGLGIGTREQNLLHLNAIWEKQKELALGGGAGLLVKPIHLFNTAAEMVKNANLKAPEMFFNDPGASEFSQPDDGQGEIERQQIAIAQRQQELDARAQAQDRQEMLLEHQREMEKLRQGQEKIANDLFVKMEQIANALTEIELKFGTDVPGAKV
jgi:hypothetical protein